MPRAFVSWRSPEPSGRIAKICSPNGFAPTGSLFDENRTVPLTWSTAVLIGASVLGGPVGIETQDFMRMHTSDAELGHDVGAGLGDDRRELLLGAAIRLDLISRKGACAGGPGVKPDGPAVEERGKPDTGIAYAQHRHVRLVRQLSARAGADVEQEDLRRFVPGSRRTEVDERDGPAVGTGCPPERAVDQLNAAGRPERPEPAAVGAHEKNALLGWLGRERRKPGELLRDLEDDPGAIREYRHGLEDTYARKRSASGEQAAGADDPEGNA